MDFLTLNKVSDNSTAGIKEGTINDLNVANCGNEFLPLWHYPKICVIISLLDFFFCALLETYAPIKILAWCQVLSVSGTRTVFSGQERQENN